jgi:hypothetical protein
MSLFFIKFFTHDCFNFILKINQSSNKYNIFLDLKSTQDQK